MSLIRLERREGIVTALVLCVTAFGGCSTCPKPPCTGASQQDASGALPWPDLFRPAGPVSAGTARAPVPLPDSIAPDMMDALLTGSAVMSGRRVQAQRVAGGKCARSCSACTCSTDPTRVILRWIEDDVPEHVRMCFDQQPAPEPDAGWDFGYRLLEESAKEVPWLPRLRNVLLEQVEYEMYQLDLRQGDRRLGLRMGIRHNDRIYWWQFVRADFLQRGAVFDILRAGGPIYNEETTIQADAYLVLFKNGSIEAYTHFVNHQREGIGRETHGVPVIAFEIPGNPAVAYELDGTQSLLDMGKWHLDLGQSTGFADADRPGSLRTEEDVVVLQPWLDQEIYGEMLIEPEGIPEHRIVPDASRAGEDGYWVAKLGDRLIPRGMARTVRFSLSHGDTPPGVARYQAPGWWHALCNALPTRTAFDGSLSYLPTSWWAVPRAEVVGEQYFTPHPRHGPFELGVSGRDQDGTLGGAMFVLGHATDESSYCEHALLPIYWWADVAIDHVDFTVHELPKYSWQWIVQPYMRWLELVYGYYETGDPYLLETSRFTADAFYRFFWTNRPHRGVGRDALACADLLALYECTGEEMYLQRTREILAEVRRSYGQTQWYWPGHQSGSGPNGVGRQPSWDYIPMLLARLHVQLIETGALDSSQELEDSWAFVRRMNEVFCEHGAGGWVLRAVSLSYKSLTALADEYPEEADEWIALLDHWNATNEMPDTHDGGKAFSWVISALRFDAWAWGATWQDGVLHLRPQRRLLEDPRAPKQATISTPMGPVVVRFVDGSVYPVGEPAFPVHVYMQ